MTAQILITVPARDVREGDVIMNGGGRPAGHVIEVDHHGNVHGRVILHTAIRADGKPSGSTVIDPDRQVTVRRLL